MLVASTIDLLIAYLPVIGENRGIGPAVIGSLLAVRATGGLLSRLSMTFILSRLSRGKVLTAVLLISGLSLMLVAGSATPWVLGIGVGVTGFCLGLGSPMTMAWLSVQTPRPDRGTVLAIRLTGNRITQVAMPSLAGVLTTFVGPGAIFGVLAAILVPASAWIRRQPTDTT